MATTNSKVKTNSTLLPQSAHHLINAANYLCEAVEIGCRGIRDATQSADEITRVYMQQHKQRLLDGAA